MHSPYKIENGHPIKIPKIKEMRNKKERRDIPNPSRILQVPKTLQIPKEIRRREINALIAMNQIMKIHMHEQ
jgi:hypothetical protein